MDVPKTFTHLYTQSYPVTKKERLPSLALPRCRGNTCLDGQTSTFAATACFDCGKGFAAAAGDDVCTECRAAATDKTDGDAT